MGVSPFSIFIQQNYKKATGKTIAERGRALGKMYRAMPAADKAKLVAAAKKAPAFKRTKIAASVRKLSRKMGVPVAVLKKHYFSVKASSTAAKIRAVAQKAKVPVRKARKH